MFFIDPMVPRISYHKPSSLKRLDQNLIPYIKLPEEHSFNASITSLNSHADSEIHQAELVDPKQIYQQSDNHSHFMVDIQSAARLLKTRQCLAALPGTSGLS